MKKLSDYIRDEKQKATDAEAELKRQSINASIEKEVYKENFNNIVIDNLYYQLMKLKSNDFGVKEILRKQDSEPYKLKLELEISINNQMAQYYITFFGDSKNKDSFYVKFEFVEGKFLLDKEITFTGAEKLNFEDYLVSLLQEINK